MLNQYLKTFFEEKDLPFAQWELVDKDGLLHVIDNKVVIDTIGMSSCSEQTGISNMIRRIDFLNGDINDYLKHLAGAIINR